MANFFSNVLKPYEKNKVEISEFVSSDQYINNVDKIKPRVAESLSSRAFNEFTMRFDANVYVFSENELKELLQNR